MPAAGPVYLYVIEGPPNVDPFVFVLLRKLFNGTYMADNGYDFDSAGLARPAMRRRVAAVPRAIPTIPRCRKTSEPGLDPQISVGEIGG